MIKEAPGRKTVLLITSGFPEKESLLYLDSEKAGGGLITQIDRLKLFDPFGLTRNSTYPEFLEEVAHLANFNLITFYGIQLGQVEEVESNFALSYLSQKTGGAYFISLLFIISSDAINLLDDPPFIRSDRYQISLKKSLDSHDGFIFDLRRTLGYPDGEIIKLLGVDSYPFFIFIKENEQRGYGYSFVPVLKWVILDQKVEEDTGFRDKARVKLLP
jgi:hypothetical protein